MKRLLLPATLLATLLLGLGTVVTAQESESSGLRVIVDLIASAPADEAILDSAMRWARDGGVVIELIEAVALRGSESSSAPLLDCAARLALEEGLPATAVPLLERSLQVADQTSTRTSLARLWLRGDHPEAAKQVLGELLEDRSHSQFQFGIELLQSHRWTSPDDHIDRQELAAWAQLSQRTEEASQWCHDQGEDALAIELAIAGGHASLVRTLLGEGILPERADLRRRIARMLGIREYAGVPLFTEGGEEEARWNASMGIEPWIIGTPFRDPALPPLMPVLALLEAGESAKARRHVALWRLAGGGPTLEDYSTRRILDAIHPEWLGIDQLPDDIEKRLRSSRSVADTSRAIAALLRTPPGSPAEARLWYQAGRLSKQQQLVDRAARIADGIVVATEPIAGVTVQQLLTASPPLDIAESIPHFEPMGPGRLLGVSWGQPIRSPVPLVVEDGIQLKRWSIDSTAAGEGSSSPLRLSLGRHHLLIGDHSRLDLVVEEVARSRTVLSIVPTDASSPPVVKDGLPTAEILTRLFHFETDEQLPRIASTPPRFVEPIETFIDAAVKRKRSDDLRRWVDFQRHDDGSLWVTVAGVVGEFSARETAEILRIPEYPAVTPTTPTAHPPGDPPDGELEFLGSRTHGVLPTASRPLVQGITGPVPLLPDGEQLLSICGDDDRVVVTDSGLVGYFSCGSARASWWLPLLDPPLAGVGGFAALPQATHRRQLPWSDEVTPRLVAVPSADGTTRFLLLAGTIHLIDSGGAQQITSRLPETEQSSCATLDDDGRLLLVTGDGTQLIDGAGAFHSIATPGAYQIISSGENTFILGQQDGSTWLAHFDGEEVREVSPPPLPDERDRPHLRVASLGRWGQEIVLLADRLWCLKSSPSQHLALTPPPVEGVYRPVHWVQTAARVHGQPDGSARIQLDRPWGVTEFWRTPR